VRIHALVAVSLVLAGCAGGAVPSAPTPAPTTAGDLGSPAADTAPAERATVTRVIDGDTVEVRLADGTEETIRLLGVDTPEVHAENTPDEFEGVPETAAGRDCLRTYGERASDYVERELAGREIGIGYDPTEERRGYYGRLLAYVYVDGEQFNARLVADGWGRVFDSEIVERERYLGLERRARTERRGLWTCADGTPVPTTANTGGGASATPLPDGGVALSVAATADAPGDDRENLNGEFVRLTNEGDESLDLSGWTVRDEADHVYRFPDGTTLAPGATLTLYTGSGEDGDGDYYWGRSSPVWNNGGDTVTVRAASGETVATSEV
jgi:micrococcal nuclease